MNNWMDNSELKLAVIQKFNNEFGSDISKLQNFFETQTRLENEKSDIENALSVSSVDVPSKISTAISHVQEALNKIEKLSEQHCSLKKSVSKYQDKVNKVKMKAEDNMNKINDLEKACEYLKLIQNIEEISNKIESGIHEKNERKQVTNYVKLRDFFLKSLKETKCTHLLTFVNDTLHYWHNILKDRFAHDYDNVMTTIKWPFTGSHLTSVPTTETMNRFQILTEHLLQIELNEKNLGNSFSEFQPLSLPIVQLIKPLRKRFLYHFMGSRQTNRADKPEWYFTQILTWIRDHQDFIVKRVQPAYDKIIGSTVLAEIEFMRGLVQIAVEKLHLELPQIQFDDSLFSHCVDEALGFDKELKSSYGYPDSEPSVIDVLTQAQFFVKWINMERRYATEKMDDILASDTAFDTFVPKADDDNRITECAERFLTLLSTTTERYEILPQPGHRLQFLQLQLDLIDDFRIRLLQKLKEENVDLLYSKFPNILNTVNYIRNVLEEWGADACFLHLHFYKAKLEGKTAYEGTVFDEYLEIFRIMRDDFLSELVDQVFMDVKAKSMPYRKDKWHVMESPKDVIQPAITHTACPMFQVLIDRLHHLQDILANSLFSQLWNSLASKLDQYIYEEIVAICMFNEGGALQFNHDITRNLFPLFGQYSSKPETHFKLLKDSCTLLSMPIGLALTLRDSLLNSAKEGDHYDAVEILADVGIYTLKKFEVLSLLSRRTDLG